MTDSEKKKVDYDHECPEWDCAFITIEDPEFSCCTCFDHKLKIIEIGRDCSEIGFHLPILSGEQSATLPFFV